MANKVRIAFKYDGMRFFGGPAVTQLKAYATHYRLPWDAAKTTWQHCIETFEMLPDYTKKLVITREPRHCRHGRYFTMLRKNEVIHP